MLVLFMPQMLKQFHVALVPSFTAEDAEGDEGDSDMEEDWLNDTNGKGIMDFRSFVHAIFEIADIWCNSTAESDYMNLLATLEHSLMDLTYNGKWLPASDRSIADRASLVDAKTLEVTFHPTKGRGGLGCCGRWA